MTRLQEQLNKVLCDLGVKTSVERYWMYFELLLKWNAAYNLTAITQPQEVLTKHFYDSLAVIPFIKGQRIVDVGTGGGFPGIPLALSMPDRHFTLLDSNSKKTRFLKQVVLQLALDNVDVVHMRAEQFTPPVEFDIVVTRAFSKLSKMVELTQHLLNEQGCFLAMKAHCDESEIQQLDNARYNAEVNTLHVPYLQQQRTLVSIKQTRQGG